MDQQEAVAADPVAEMKDKLLRSLATIENMRKQKAIEVAEARDQGEADVARLFIEVLDNMDRAFVAMKDADGPEAMDGIKEGFQLVFDHFGRVLDQLEIKGYDYEGKKFFAEVMEAIAEKPTHELPPGTVTDQICRGYTRKGRLLRAAQVVVAVAPKEDDNG